MAKSQHTLAESSFGQSTDQSLEIKRQAAAKDADNEAAQMIHSPDLKVEGRAILL